MWPLLDLSEKLLAHRGKAQGFCAFEDDLAGDQAVVVDAAGHGVLGAGIDDVLEGSVLVNEAERVIAGKMVADGHTGVIHSHQSGSVVGVRIIDVGESAILPEEAIANYASCVESGNHAVIID